MYNTEQFYGHWGSFHVTIDFQKISDGKLQMQIHIHSITHRMN